jgi:hypothetical protein
MQVNGAMLRGRAVARPCEASGGRHNDARGEVRRLAVA